MQGLYIHVPFCQKRCHYCSFYSTTHGRRERHAYTEALVTELAGRRAEITEPLSTVYLGGGTPSQLDDEDLRTIFEAIHARHSLADDVEITIECNPDDLVSRPSLAQLLAQLGVNRVSMGVQSFCNASLRAINRRHTADDVHTAIESLHAADIHNISIDLMYGLPGQSLEVWQRDVTIATELATATGKVTHISSYALTVEPDTHLYNMREKGDFLETDEQTSLTMYNALVDALTHAGFDHYEISNFAIPGYASRHNSNYWRGVPYVGLGPGAHSYDGRIRRRWNHTDLTAYIASPLTTYDDEILSPAELYDELILTRLRTREGLSLAGLSETQKTYLLRMAQPYIAGGQLRLEQDTLALTRRGIFISDAIFADLMWDPDLPL